MTLLISLHKETMHPDHGGHYANCPRDKWDTHLAPYIMGDVEVAYKARNRLEEKLAKSRTYRMPLAHTSQRGFFRYYQPPNRKWIYDNIMAPASRMLAKMMGRGMFIDQKQLASMERFMPAKINEVRAEMAHVSPVVQAWVERKQATDNNRNDPERCWEFDLDNKEQMQDLLF
jgi:hypothetical protein